MYFPSPKAALPVIKKTGEIEWVTWGRRKEEDVPNFPNGGWARLDSIKSGTWQRYQPVPVLIYVNAFMEKDGAKVSHWFDVNPDEVIQGLLTVNDNVARVYVVTTDTPPEFNYIHDRWPRLIQQNRNAESLPHD